MSTKEIAKEKFETKCIVIKYENSRAENRKMAEYISIPDTKSGKNLKLNKVVKEIWIPDIRHILLKYKKKISATIRKIAKEIPISDIRPIRIKYDKLIASFKKNGGGDLKEI